MQPCCICSAFTVSPGVQPSSLFSLGTLSYLYLSTGKHWVDTSSPCLLKFAFAHLFCGNPYLRPCLCATGRQTRKQKAVFWRGCSVFLLISALSKCRPLLLGVTPASPALSCAPAPTGWWPGMHSSVADAEIFVHSFVSVGGSGLLKDRQAWVTSGWILQRNMIILIHLENCQIHDEMNCDVASSSENVPLAFNNCVLYLLQRETLCFRKLTVFPLFHKASRNAEWVLW